MAISSESKSAEKVDSLPSIRRGSMGEITMPEKGVSLPAGADDALALFGGHVEEFEYTPKEANWVRWKLDLILLPLMAITYILNYMDKVALTEASIFGIQEDLHLSGNNYSWASSVFYFGYLFWQYPSSILMQKLPIGRYFGTMVMMWGVVCTCTVATTNFKGLAVNRVFLGMLETCMSPILTILVGQYWTREEQPLRTCIWWSGSAIGGYIADAITYGVSGSSLTNGKYETWQVVYLIFGPVTIVFGIVLMFGIPTAPMTAWFLSEKERKIAVLRVVHNQTGIENRQYKWNQVQECLIDPQAWMLCFLTFLQSIPGGGLTAFGKIILGGLGYSSRQSTLMAMPSDTIHFVSVIFAGLFCSYVRNSRCIVMLFSNVIVLIGGVLVNTLPKEHLMSRLASFYILYVNTISFGICMALLSSNIAGFTKKSTATVMLFVGYCVGQFAGPQFFKSSESPNYPTGFRALYISTALMIAIQITLPIYLLWQNRRRDHKTASAATNEHSITSDLMDLTDWEQPEFRYVW